MARPVDEIQADLVLAYASRRAALKAEAYSQDTGQNRVQVTRNLISIQKIIKDLEAELAEASPGGPLYMELCR